MSTTEATANSETEINFNADARIEAINDAADRLFEAIVKDGQVPADARVAIEAGLTLLCCGLIALTEIASAQLRMADLASRDYAADIAQAVEEAAELKVAAKLAETTKRSFIGKK